jgi:hypothetical protein
MRTRRAAIALVGMERARRRVERWRERRAAGMSMPESLWAMAAQLARRHGIYPTARVLGLEYNKLKRLSQPSNNSNEAAKSTRSVPPPTFVELMAPAAEPACRIELEGQAGSKLKIELPASASAALVMELCRVMCGGSR